MSAWSLMVLALSAAPARAASLLDDEPPGPPVTRVRTVGVPLRVGLVVGWHATSGDADVLGERVVGNEPSTGPAFGLRLGWRVTPGWGIDVTAAAIPAGSEWLVPLVAELRWRPLEGAASWTPTVALGAGAYVGVGAGGDVDALFAATTGFEVVLGAEVGVHVEGGVWATDAVRGSLAWSPVVLVGIELRGWRDHAGTDVDGERAPRVPRPPVVRGCPPGVPTERCGDVDGDGIIDAFDACPVDPGTVEGCPDDDGDGVPAPRDACPFRSGADVDWGCPR